VLQAENQRVLDRISCLLGYATPEERVEIQKIAGITAPVWVPLPGPQTQAYECEADITYYGGAAGGGKSDLLLGLALTQHLRSIIFRREATQLVALQDRLLDEILKSRDGWNGQEDILRLPVRQIEFGSCKNPGDEIKYQGRPHDFIGVDEITHLLEPQFRFLCGWLRTVVPGQRCRIVCAGNPPTTQEGQWVSDFWGPWLNDKHPNPAKPGEIRWFAVVDGQDVERPDGAPFTHKDETIRPQSRTFIPSRVTDNPFLVETDYMRTLQALPEPLRSQMLHGDFRAGTEDSEWQVIPTAWVDAAMARWNESGKTGSMDSIGVDVARGGRASTIIAKRYGVWYDRLKKYPGAETPNGSITAGVVVSERRDGAPVHVDVIGVGGSVVDHLRSNDVQVVDINGAEKVPDGSTDVATGRLRFRNMRALLWWRMREALDPQIGHNVALPPDPELKADLCSPTWDLTPGGILIESKEQMMQGPRPHKLRPLGRSPDKGDAVVYCNVSTVKLSPNRKDWRAHVKQGTWRSR
jgi:hypothetical protein